MNKQSQEDPSPSADRHRALVSLKEELEAIDWYDQRSAACADDELARILRHNRDEELEHALMLLEWLRRTDPNVDTLVRRHLFSSKGEISTGGTRTSENHDASLRLGDLKGELTR